jgi:hypothetical protein
MRPNSRDFFVLSDDDDESDSAMQQFSLPRGLKVKAKAKAKPAAKKPSGKRASAKRLSAKRGSAKRLSVKRGSVRRVSKRKTSRPVQAVAPVRPVHLPAAEVRKVSIPRPAPPARPEPLVALFSKQEPPPPLPFGGPQAMPVLDGPPRPFAPRAFGRVAPKKIVSISEMEEQLSQMHGEVPGAARGRAPDLSTAPGWVELLKLVPQTIERLGIAAAVQDDTFADKKLGRGLYAMVFELPDPLFVLKLTRDPEDAYIAKLVVDDEGIVRGLARTESIFRIQLPFEIPDSQRRRNGVPVGQVNVVYGMVVERAVPMSLEGDGRDILLQKAMQDLHIDLPDAATLLRRAYGEANQILEKAEEAREERRENYFEKYYNPERPGDTQTERDFRAGTAWCAARGLRFDADAHRGNFGLVWRGNRFACVKIDLGHRSVDQGRGYATEEVRKLPLAANRDRP